MNRTKSQVNTQITRWPYLLVGIISMLFAGIIYAWSILKVPLAQSFGWTPSQLGLNFTITLCFFCIGGFTSGFLTKKTSPKVSTIIGGLLVSSGFILASRMSGNSITALYIYYGGMGGMGIGMAYIAVIASTNAWFPDKKGTSSGALMMGFGTSTLLLGSVASNMINTESIGWRGTYFALGVAIGIILLLAGLIVKFPSPDTKFPQPKVSKKAKVTDDFEAHDYMTSEMIKRFTFWRYFFFSVTLAAVGSTVISFARDLVMSFGATAALATSLVGVLSICNGLGRVISGLLFDALGRRRTMLIANIIAIFATAVTLLAVISTSLPVGIIGLCLTGISYGCSPTISSAFISSFYGSKYFPMNFSIANMILIPASFTATLAGSMVASTGSYAVPCIMLLVLSLISLLLGLSIKRP